MAHHATGNELLEDSVEDGFCTVNHMYEVGVISNLKSVDGIDGHNLFLSRTLQVDGGLHRNAVDQDLGVKELDTKKCAHRLGY